jgi:hypothetical protein
MHENYIPVLVVGIVFGSLGFVITVGMVIAGVSYHLRCLQARRLGSELIHEMLQRKMQPDEIERILKIWSEGGLPKGPFAPSLKDAKSFDPARASVR